MVTVKAARFYEIKRPLGIGDVDIPKNGAKDILVKVKAYGLCHRSSLPRRFVETG